MANHVIGLLLGMEDDWPAAFESLVRRANLRVRAGGDEHTFDVRRVEIEPFRLRADPTHDLVIDRLAWWYQLPREWLKKLAMLNEVYLLNDPFTFQSMEKHTAYCAMMRLGMNIPETWMLPTKVGPDNERFAETARRYNRLFDLDAIADRIGYPLFMKPFDGGGWVGVTQVDSRAQLHAAYDASGQRLMHLQQAVLDYDVFVRGLSIGPQTRIMRYRPERPQHDRYDTAQGFLDDDMNTEMVMTGRVINAFFRWEFNSCECIVKHGVASPIDFANACPDVSLTSLHAHFPWAITALVKWSIFCAATGRRMALDMDKRRYFEIADRPGLDPRERLEAYFALSEAYFETERFEAFCATELRHVDEVAFEYFTSPAFDELLVATVLATFRPHEHEHFVAHYRRLMAHWATDAAGGSAATG